MASHKESFLTILFLEYFGFSVLPYIKSDAEFEHVSIQWLECTENPLFFLATFY